MVRVFKMAQLVNYSKYCKYEKLNFYLKTKAES